MGEIGMKGLGGAGAGWVSGVGWCFRHENARRELGDEGARVRDGLEEGRAVTLVRPSSCWLSEGAHCDAHQVSVWVKVLFARDATGPHTHRATRRVEFFIDAVTFSFVQQRQSN